MHEHSPESYYHSETCRARSCAASTSPKEVVFHTANTLPRSVGANASVPKAIKHKSTWSTSVRIWTHDHPRTLEWRSRERSCLSELISGIVCFHHRQPHQRARFMSQSVLWSFASARPARKVKEHRALNDSRELLRQRANLNRACVPLNSMRLSRYQPRDSSRI